MKIKDVLEQYGERDVNELESKIPAENIEQAYKLSIGLNSSLNFLRHEFVKDYKEVFDNSVELIKTTLKQINNLLEVENENI